MTAPGEAYLDFVKAYTAYLDPGRPGGPAPSGCDFGLDFDDEYKAIRLVRRVIGAVGDALGKEGPQ